MTLNDLPKIDATRAPQALSTDVPLEKYAEVPESLAEDIDARVSHSFDAIDQPVDQACWRARLPAALTGGFIPAGRLSSAPGTGIRTTLLNCIVPPVGDSVCEDVAGTTSTPEALTHAAETTHRGGGVGHDFSRIHPRGGMVKGTHSNASGLAGYRRICDAHIAARSS